MKLIYKILQKLNYAHMFNFLFKLNINKQLIKIPVIQNIGSNNLLLSEMWMIQLLEQLKLDETKNFIDVGINVGQTLIKYKSVYPNGNYIGFEPNPSCVYYVNNLIESNKFTNTSIFPIGLGINTEMLSLQFYSDSKVDAAASAVKNFRPLAKVTKTINIPIFKGHLIDSFQNMSAIKIDVEGMEDKVLRGILSHLKKQKPPVLMEILPIYSKNNLDRIQLTRDIEQIMIQELGYKMYQIIKTEDDHFDRLEEISQIEIHSDLTKCDFLFK